MPGHLFNHLDGLFRCPRSMRGNLGFTVPEEAKPLPMPTEERVRLDDEEGLSPGTYFPGQQHEEHSVGAGQPWLLDAPTQDDELLPEKGVLGNQLRFGPREVGKRTQDLASISRLGPSQKSPADHFYSVADHLFETRAQGEQHGLILQVGAIRGSRSNLPVG